MARILTDTDSIPWQWIRFAALGVVLGILYFVLSVMLERYVVGPVACGSGDPVRCLESTGVAGGIASIIVAVVGLFGAIRFYVPRPLLVVVGATIMTVGLSTWVNELFWLEALGWSALVYLLAYLLFVGIFQFRNLIASISVSIVIIVAERITLTL